MKRTVTLMLAALVATALFGGLVYAVLVAAQLADPAATTVYGLTFRRLWATVVALLALIGVIMGGLALARPAGRSGPAAPRRGFSLATGVALGAGLIAVLNGALNLAVANGGPGTGNGVVAAAGALVLGLIALVMGGLGVARARSAG